ncbi:penicillin-binding transpeptidase domain-containing protein, partial [Mesorhizobium sp. Cs1321R2N1]|uniref:penicillin-binding transpeptidase domain-containing protein n=1 Tax=Mesorhizobium sp. Cs1321R2N1 TaxID=3015174 RepID=UPI00301C40AD
YMSKFAYGNKDVSGDAGKDNGLTQSWINSSLEISPVEQTAFLRQMLAGKMPVSAKAHEMTKAIVPTVAAGDWTVQGKTGSTKLGQDGKRSLGWFVGWAERDGRRIIFARLVVDAKRTGEPKGVATRAAFLKDLPGLIK